MATQHSQIQKPLQLQGPQNFRLRLAFSLLTSTPIQISDIRTKEVNVGLNQSEISFLKLVDQITNGTKVKISETGTSVAFHPGTITNNYGEEFLFQSDPSRCVSYYLEGLLPIALYGKETLRCKLAGATNGSMDLSADCFKTLASSIVGRLVVGDSLELEISQRSFAQQTTGLVKFKCPIVKFLEPFEWVNPGVVKKIGGNVFTSNCPNAKKLINETRVILNDFLNEVWIGENKHNAKGLTPGFAISLWGVTTEGFCYGSDLACHGQADDGDLADRCCRKLLEEIYYVGRLI